MDGARQRPRPNSAPIPISDLEEFIIDENDGDVQIHIASYKGDLVQLQKLLQLDHTDVNRRVRPFGATPLRLAATSNHPECIKYLMEKGALVDLVDFKTQTPLFVAIQKQNLKCANLLLEAGANPNGDIGNRCSTLCVAAREGYIKGIKLLLRYGADPEIEDRLVGVPGLPLHTAAIYHHYECYTALLLAGAHSNLKRIYPNLPQYLYSMISLSHTLIRHRCSLQMGKLFVEFGGNLWQQDKTGLLATELPQECSLKLFFQKQLGEPLSLRSSCRLRIRHVLGRKKLKFIPSLPLPKSLLDFLHYTDLIKEPEKLIYYPIR